MKKRLLFLAPHLSTGGLPQYLYKQIELLQNEFDIYCIEWANITGGVLVIQRNRISNLLKDKLITLGEDKEKELFSYINKLKPNIIHLQEIPEIFTLPYDIASKLYSTDRKYVLIETSHDSSFDIKNKKFFPDHFLMVSQYQVNEYKKLNIPVDLVEYPIETKIRTKTREEALQELGLDPNLKHIINVGLFTPRKNQAEVIEYAKRLKDYPIQFHFLGNQADNFKWYWEPLMKDFPSNCKWWNERDDVDKFYEATDLFLFTSRGSETDKETMPLVIREAISWKKTSLIYNLPVYLNYFDKFDNINYLDFDSLDNNCNKILNKLDLKQKNEILKECIIISTYTKTKAISDLTKQCIENSKKFNLPIILTSHCEVPEEIQKLVDYCIVDNNNILTKHTFYKKSWYNYLNYYVEINLEQENNDLYHGPAVYTNYYNGINLAKSLGFEFAYCYNFDMILENDITIQQTRYAYNNEFKALMNLHQADEGLTLRTVWHAINVDLFLENFPLILNENEYNNWYLRIGSESNGLENIYYHALKNNLQQIKIINNDEFYKMFQNSKIDICSQIEYFTILPIQDDLEKGAICFSSSHKQDGRLAKFYINNELIETKEIIQNTIYVKEIILSNINNIKIEIFDIYSNKLLFEKSIDINNNYIIEQLPKNGICIIKK